MSERERLQKAIETTIAAGYQMDREAFELLCTISATEDPNNIINRALLKMDELEEKPMFICKSFLEEILKPTATIEITATPTETGQPQPAAEEQPKKSNKSWQAKEVSPFQPYAKGVEAKVEVLEDPSSKLTSNGTIEEYQQYFQDRFKRLEKLLRQRMDLKAATPIQEALKSQPKTKVKIIGMVTEKRDAKQQTMITLEDLEASATILVPTKGTEELHRKTQLLLCDQVICVAAQKTRGTMFLAEDIIFPEVGQKPSHRADEPVFAVLTSDIHVGSKKFNKEPFKHFIQWLQGKYGDDEMLEIASHVKYVLMAGDLVDGVGVYPGQSKELAIKDIYTQYKALASYIRRIPEYIEVLLIPGDHDAAPKALPQPAISKEYSGELFNSKRVHLLPDPCTVSIHGVEILMYHGRSLIDIASAIPGVALGEAHKAMKTLIQCRHLAPTYGQRTQLVPTSQDCLVIERVPDILHTGHLHLLKHEMYRGVLMVNAGCWQAQTEYQEKGGIVPTPNVIFVVNLQTMQVVQLDFG
jgi:DNA polymerase II small subunit